MKKKNHKTSFFVHCSGRELWPIFTQTRPYNVFKTIFSSPYEWKKANQRLLYHWKYFPCSNSLFILWELIMWALAKMIKCSLAMLYVLKNTKQSLFSPYYLSLAPAFKISWRDLVRLRVFNFKNLQSMNHDTQKLWQILWKNL